MGPFATICTRSDKDVARQMQERQGEMHGFTSCFVCTNGGLADGEE